MSTHSLDAARDPSTNPEEGGDGGDDPTEQSRAHDGEREPETPPAERDQLAAEVERLRRELDRKESQLDAVRTQNERILRERTESYRRHLDGERDDGFEWTGRRRGPGLLARLKRLVR